MRLSKLFEGIEALNTAGSGDPEIRGLSTDSRNVREGDLFIALRGHAADGHDYIENAVNAGAAALAVERPVDTDIPVVVLVNTSTAEALLARRFYGDPSSRLVLTGITGTNGKTSTAFLLQSILDLSHGPAGIIGTVGFGSRGKLQAATHTTPSSVELNRILARFAGRGCRSAVMEVSSHAARQGRIAGMEFDVGIFTNITRDHLDYHLTLENYIEAKERFVRTLSGLERRKGEGVLVYNIDDDLVRAVGERFEGRKLSFGEGAKADYRCEGLRAGLEGTSFELRAPDFELDVSMKLPGRFGAWNAMAAAAAARAAGASPEHIKEGLERVELIPGRFQVVSKGAGPSVVVDYAHTPDALEKLLLFCRELEPSRLITVFGCGGDRDRGKRPMMGGISMRLSDMVYVTSDNPRTEDPDAIIKDVLEGMRGYDTPFEAVTDRGEAIRRAVGSAREGELVVLAGKGHEDYQVLAGETIHFSDSEEAEKALAALAANGQD